MMRYQEVSSVYLKIYAGLKEKEDSGEIGFLGKSQKRPDLIVGPTSLLSDSTMLNEFSRTLLPNENPVYQFSSGLSPIDRRGGLSYVRLGFQDDNIGRRVCVCVIPDDQLAEAMVDYENGSGLRYPTASVFEGLMFGLNKFQLTTLKKNPVGFIQELKREIEIMNKKPASLGFLPVGGAMSRPRQTIAGVGNLV